VYAVLRAAAARLGPGGRLINIGSSSTLYPSPECALYFLASDDSRWIIGQETLVNGSAYV
jgi:hypothetical protein